MDRHIERLAVTPGATAPHRPDGVWPRIVARATRFLAQRGAPARDAICLVPTTAHASLLRQAWARHGGWMPRIETVATLARTCAAPAPPRPMALSFDRTLDGLSARRRLLAVPAASGWARRDPPAWRQACQELAATAAALARAAASCAPARREAWWHEAALRLSPAGRPVRALETALAALALDWARDSLPLTTDALFDLRPAAWIDLQLGPADAFNESLLRAAEVPTLRIMVRVADDPGRGDLDPTHRDTAAEDTGFDAIEAGFEAVARGAHVSAAACSDLEDEAMVAAGAILKGLQRGVAPIALVSVDRLVVRRISALLQRAGVAVHDETGWRLSTSRAAASLMSWLRVMRPGAGADDWLDALKPLRPEGSAPPSLAHRALETWIRRVRWGRIDDPLPPSCPGFVVQAVAELHDLRHRWWDTPAGAAPIGDPLTSRPLAQWLGRTAALLEATGLAPTLRLDVAGRALLEVLRLDGRESALGNATADSWISTTAAIDLDFDGFVDWVDEVLESAEFSPSADDAMAGADRRVVITSLPGVALRPFAAVVLPGADERALGARSRVRPWIDDITAVQLGLPDDAARRARERHELLFALAAPEVALSWRAQDDDEILQPAASLAWLEHLAHREGAAPLASPADARAAREVSACPQRRGEARLRVGLPQRLTASGLEALRACPYRFFVGTVLRLAEPVELDEPPDKRRYGEWLHRVLHDFHRARNVDGPRTPAQDHAALSACGQAARAAMALDPDEFALFDASFGHFVPRYLDWLHGHESAGWRWAAGELALQTIVGEWGDTVLDGRLDRVDRSPEGVQVIDYKTSSAGSLDKRRKDPAEDTQLLVYAALLQRHDGSTAGAASASALAGRVRAVYLALDGKDGLEVIEHQSIDEHVPGFIDAVARDLAGLRGGEPARALGEGDACRYCEARGVCRRDHAFEIEAAEPGSGTEGAGRPGAGTEGAGRPGAEPAR